MVFGCYFNARHPSAANSNKQIRDPDAFVYWLNEHTYFPAEDGTDSQFDVSPELLLSVGSTKRGDGFWFQNDFKQLSPGNKDLLI